MDGDRNERALTRIEAALARIEAAARKPKGVQTGSDTDGALAALQTRHDRLRAEVAGSLAELDTLIESTQG